MMDKSEFLTKYTSHLNDNQLRAVQTVNGPVLLLAVPGSGKTTVLVNRLGYMVFCEGIDPANILTLTYTVAATNDMARRFTTVFGEQYANLLEFRTINGICSKIIRRYAQMIGKPEFDLLSEEKEKARILTEILVKNMSEYPTESDVKGASTLITYCKNMLLENDEIEALGEDEGLPLLEVYTQYNQYLRNNRLMDYDDQMIYAYRMLKGSPELLQYYRDLYKYICVDEAQDTSKVQHIIIGMLAGENGNLFMVGDEDQSIYGFRAAYPEALLNFEKDHLQAQVLVMDQNYRSNAKIVAAADMFIQHNKARHEKHMVSTREEASDIDLVELRSRNSQYNYLLKLANGCNRETAVLYRDNECILPLIDLLDRQKIPFRIKSVDMAFFTHRIVMDVTNIMRFAMNPSDTELFMRIYFKCQTFLKKNQAERLCQVSRERNIPVLEAVGFVGSINGMVAGKCKALATHLKSMLKEPPGKALFRIETPLGYGEYLERNNIDDNKLFILKMIAANEVSVYSFLARLEYLQGMLKEYRADRNCPFILSTIHSSKGLEYDRVYLMDVCDGVFPVNVIRSSNSATPQERKNFEEERRLFYVGMTRAKNELNILKYSDNASVFLSEMRAPVKKAKAVDVKAKGGTVLTGVGTDGARQIVNLDFDLVIGERIVQDTLGPGVVSDIDYDANGKADKFTVTYDSGEEKRYVFPIAFKKSMRLESGAQVFIKAGDGKAGAGVVVARPVSAKSAGTAVAPSSRAEKARKTRQDSYAYWEQKYPDYVVIKKEGYFWTCRGESAETLGMILGYNVSESAGRPVTGSPSLDKIIGGLRHNRISYVAISGGEVVEIEEF